MIVLIVDAMAIHVADVFRRALASSLSADPTKCDYLLAPVPTITEVCKAAILTGRYPSQAARDLGQTICETYSLSHDQVLLAGSWEDPVRLRVTPKTRLIVYRDNRLDDRLHSTGSYRELLRDCDTLADRLAAEGARLVSDVRCLSGSNPLVLLTADHGFTYGPPPGAETVSHRPLDPDRRCVVLSDGPSPAEAAEAGLTFIDGEAFHTGRDFLAARGRSFGSGTSTGWKLSHGGLLPEEVMIPLLEWYGAEVVVHWPAIEALGEAVIEQGTWIVRLRLRNRGPLPILAGDVRVASDGVVEQVKAEFPALAPTAVWDVTLQVPASTNRESSDLALSTTTAVTIPSGERRTLQRTVTVPRARQLIERTGAQNAFESMFG